MITWRVSKQLLVLSIEAYICLHINLRYQRSSRYRPIISKSKTTRRHNYLTLNTDTKILRYPVTSNITGFLNIGCISIISFGICTHMCCHVKFRFRANDYIHGSDNTLSKFICHFSYRMMLTKVSLAISQSHN